VVIVPAELREVELRCEGVALRAEAASGAMAVGGSVRFDLEASSLWAFDRLTGPAAP